MPNEFTFEDYLKRIKDYKLCGGAIVSGSFQAFDQTYLIDALKKLGPSFVGVTQVSAKVSDEEIIYLNDLGVRAVRFNLKRGGSKQRAYLASMARRVYDLVGWHVELYVDPAELFELYDILIKLPSVSIDHLGLSKSGLGLLKKLVDKGIKVKATGFGRVDFEVESALKELYAVNSQALMFGTDLPSTRAVRAYRDEDFLLVIDALGEDGAANVLSRNALEFYKLK